MVICAHALPCIKVFLGPRQRFSVDGKYFISFRYRISVDGEHFMRFKFIRIDVASTACGLSLLLLCRSISEMFGARCCAQHAILRRAHVAALK